MPSSSAPGIKAVAGSTSLPMARSSRVTSLTVLHAEYLKTPTYSPVYTISNLSAKQYTRQHYTSWSAERNTTNTTPGESPLLSVPSAKHRADSVSGEPGTHGREPFEDDDTNSNQLDVGRAAAAGGGAAVVGRGSGESSIGQDSGSLASDSHRGTLSRDTERRDGEVVGLGGPKDVSPIVNLRRSDVDQG